MKDDPKLYLTEEGYRALEAELKQLTTVERHRVADQFREYKEHGETGDEAEFESLKSQQAMLESRIHDVKAILARATVVKPSDVPTDHVSVGCLVEIQDAETNKKQKVQVVGAAEADPLKGRISYLAPLGEALMGRKKGDSVDVKLPHGRARYKVLKISK
ncbi:MAG: transcription elongation factor GreA [Armatimonadetes bacterium]|nr:transcription elongation factor GreA [Armatimonadota bacterium]